MSFNLTNGISIVFCACFWLECSVLCTKRCHK